MPATSRTIIKLIRVAITGLSPLLFPCPPFGRRHLDLGVLANPDADIVGRAAAAGLASGEQDREKDEPHQKYSLSRMKPGAPLPPFLEVCAPIL
jgi:hypothetical protein